MAMGMGMGVHVTWLGMSTDTGSFSTGGGLVLALVSVILGGAIYAVAYVARPATAGGGAALAGAGCGFAHPLFAKEALVGVLTIGRLGGALYRAGEASVIQTFGDFLGIQLRSAQMLKEQMLARLNLRELEITADFGVFARLGWNDGKTESFAFTAIDRLATGGVSVTGRRWHRPFDTFATEFTASGLSSVHAGYLAQGGHDFLIGDGRLSYRPEYIAETYYSLRVLPGVFASLDLQHVSNPAYNRDRGPVWISSIRLHVELGKTTFTGHAGP